jgi:hypothetical protein
LAYFGNRTTDSIETRCACNDAAGGNEMTTTRRPDLALIVLLVLLVLPFSAMPAQAAPLDLLLIPSILLREDSLLFSNFSADLFVFGQGQPRTLSEIDVSGITVNGASGLRVSGGVAPPNAGNDSGVMLAMGYDVTAVDARHPIRAITVTIADFFVVGGGSVVRVMTDFVELSVQGHSFTTSLGYVPVQGSATAIGTLGSAMPTLHFDALFEITNTGMAGIAQAGPFDVTFHQSVSEPAPLTLLVLGLGLVALSSAAWRLRRILGH